MIKEYKIKETQTICRRPSDAAVRLANDIYYTYLQEETPYIRISVSRLCEVFGDHEEMEVKICVAQIFEELNEPIALQDFVYNGETIAWRMVHFFDYHFCHEEYGDYIDLEIHEIYLEALKNLDDQPYINFQ